MIDGIVNCLRDAPKPIRMCEWTREWLESRDDATVVRCWIDTAEFRLNPNKSTDFLELGISSAERHARIIEFVCAREWGELSRMCVELIERTLLMEEALDSKDGLNESIRDVAILLTDMVKNSEAARRDGIKNLARAGGRARAANDPKSEAMAEIRKEWERRRRPGAQFAREMHAKYAGTIQSEASIKNAISRWRKETSSS